MSKDAFEALRERLVTADPTLKLLAAKQAPLSYFVAVVGPEGNVLAMNEIVMTPAP